MGIPKSGTPITPDEHRLLDLDEVVKKGDLFWSPHYEKWKTVKNNSSMKAGDCGRSGLVLIYARPISDDVRAEQWKQVARNLDNMGIKTINLESRMANNPEYGTW